MSNLHRCFLPSFISFGQAVSEEKLFQKSNNKKQELPMMAMFVNESKRNQQFPQRTFHRCFLPSFGLFGQAVSEQKIFRNQNFLWWPCLLTDQDKMSNLYKRTFHRCFLPSFGSFGDVVSEEKIFRNTPIRNKNCLWWPCLLMDWNEMSTLYRGSPIDASYQVLDHLAEWFQRR